MKSDLIRCRELATLALLIVTPVWAGDKPLVIEDAVAATGEKEPLGVAFATGYMSNYVFYGADYGPQAYWTGLDYTLPTTIPITLGVWYIKTTDGPAYDELDLYASVSQEVAGFDATFTSAGYFSPISGTSSFANTIANSSFELGLALERGLGIVDWNGSAIYDFIIGGWYFETGLSKGVALCDAAELVLSGGIAFQHGYNADGSDWNHAYAMIAMPVTLRENVTVEPYVASLFVLDAVESFQDDLIHAGVSLNVSF